MTQLGRTSALFKTCIFRAGRFLDSRVRLLFYSVPVLSANLEAERLLPYLQTPCAFQGLRVGVFPLGDQQPMFINTAGFGF